MPTRQGHFTLSVEMTGAAFEYGAAPGELARLLRRAADYAEGVTHGDAMPGKLVDSNGNICGVMRCVWPRATED